MNKELKIFKPRRNYKPFEYPGVNEYVKLINKSFWTHDELNFDADIQDFKVSLNEVEKSAVKRALLSIAQIEVAVKTFWGNLYNVLPKPEFNGMGATFAECEFRHSEAYSRLLEVLGFNQEFEELLKVPVFLKKYELSEKYLKNEDDFLFELIFFTIVIENASLFSQFATILSFTRFKGYMKNVANIISWTSIDEQLHAYGGIYIVNNIISEMELSDEEKTKLENKVHKFILEYMELESNLVDWIYEKGDLSFFSRTDLINFMKGRIDDSLSMMNFNKLYNLSNEQLSRMNWFEEEVYAGASDDFFAKRPVDYTKHDKSITKDDLF